MADTNLIKKADLARVREVDFVNMFGYSVKKLLEALGVTRKIAKQAGTTLKSYKATGTLEDGAVAEGETIPLSKYKTEAVTYKEIILKKWRKATTAEAIVERGFDQAVGMTTEKMLQDIQKGIRKDFFDFLLTGTGVANGATFQAALAQAWGQLQVLFEDDAIQAVHFMNPLDVADYLATAQITMQTAFGMNYVEDFLGLGTVFFNSSVTKGKIISTAKENVVLYYIAVNGADLDEAFTFTADETGLIGIHEDSDYNTMTCLDVAISGLVLFAERIDGIVVSSIGTGVLTVTSVAGTSTGDTKVTVTPAKASGSSYKYKVGDATQDVIYGQNVQSWTAWNGTTDITVTTGKVITLVECDAAYKALKVGSATVTAKA